MGKFYGQELRLGVENNAAGDCSIEVCMDQLNFRPEFDEMRLDEGEPQFYREKWFREIERVAWGTVFSEDYTESEWKTGWEFMRQPRNYEHALGDMVMAGIAHCNRVDILVIYTNANAFRSFDLVRADTFGGGPAVVDAPIIVAYNGTHYESLVPVDAVASDRSVEFKRAILRDEVNSVISGNVALEELYWCRNAVDSSPVVSQSKPPVPVSGPKNQVKIVVGSKFPTKKQSKFPERHARDPKTLIIGSSPQKRKPPVEVAEGAVKKLKSKDVSQSPAQTGSSKLTATSKHGKPVISCKKCGGEFVNLKIHLGKSASCRSEYGGEVENSQNSKPLAGVSKASGKNKSPKSSASNKFEILKDGVEDTCKVCGEGFKRLLRHLRESASCGKEYGDLDQLD